MKRGGPLKRKTPLEPGAPLKRGSALSRGGPLKQGSGPASGKGLGGSRRKSEGGPRVPAEVRAVVLARAGLRCERCGRDVAGGGGEVHHRRPAGAGGSKLAESHSAANLLLLCSDGHRWVESHREAALEAGWLVRQGVDPAEVPVLVLGRWVLLDRQLAIRHPVDAQPTIV